MYIGESNPIFAHGKNVSFPIFPHFCPWEKWEKSIRKEREKYSFPLFPYTFFPIFSHEKNGKRYIFPMGKNGVGPPYIILIYKLKYNQQNQK